MQSSTPQLWQLLHHWRTLLSFGALGLVLAILLSFVQPLQYSSTTRLLITQELGLVDAYTASRSTESVANTLVNIVYTSKFYDKVLASGYPIDESYFAEDATLRGKQWAKAVSVSISRSSGFITVTAFHPDVSQAEKLAQAVAYVLSKEGWSYVSGGNIAVQIVDDPLNSHYPVRPNLFVNGTSGLVLGLLAGAGYALIQTERLRRRHQIFHSNDQAS
jgi:capsular polysaccharide biosynthesis protein